MLEDMAFVYDGLNRLVGAYRGAGTFDRQNNAWSSWGTASQEWSLDMLGNWPSVLTDGTYGGAAGDGDFQDSGESEFREHNFANEITLAGPPDTDPPTLPFAYDAGGNLKSEATGANDSITSTHDAWNRLVAVGAKHQVGQLITTKVTTKNEYNALHWRVHKYARITPSSISYDESRRMRYSAGWQLLEESIDDDYSSAQGHDETRLAQQVWGARYIDDAVLRRIDRGDGASGDPDGDFDDAEDDTYFYLTDAQFSVRALIREATGLLAERVFYDAYGRAHWRSPADFNSDGVVDTSDATAYFAVYNNSATHDPSSSSYDHRSDFTNDGAVNTQDTTQFLNAWNAPQPSFADAISVTGAEGPDNAIGFSGYVFNCESQLYAARSRHYGPTIGRWYQRDPKGYVDGMTFYQYALAQPVHLTDPYGRQSRPGQKMNPDLLPPGAIPRGNETSAEEARFNAWIDALNFFASKARDQANKSLLHTLDQALRHCEENGGMGVLVTPPVRINDVPMVGDLIVECYSDACEARDRIMGLRDQYADWKARYDLLYEDPWSTDGDWLLRLSPRWWKKFIFGQMRHIQDDDAYFGTTTNYPLIGARLFNYYDNFLQEAVKRCNGCPSDTQVQQEDDKNAQKTTEEYFKTSKPRREPK